MKSDTVRKGTQQAPHRSLFNALGYTKEMITNLRGMPFGVKSLEKRQNDLISRLFDTNERGGINATRLVVKALQLHIIDLEHLEPDEE